MIAAYVTGTLQAHMCFAHNDAALPNTDAIQRIKRAAKLHGATPQTKDSAKKASLGELKIASATKTLTAHGPKVVSRSGYKISVMTLNALSVP